MSFTVYDSVLTMFRMWSGPEEQLIAQHRLIMRLSERMAMSFTLITKNVGLGGSNEENIQLIRFRNHLEI